MTKKRQHRMKLRDGVLSEMEWCGMANAGERTASELQAASEHLLYEIEMLVMTHHLRRSPCDRSSANVALPALSYALLESSLIHVRNLAGFFWNDGTDPRDVYAREFFPDHERHRSVCLLEGSLLTNPETRPRIDKFLAHLTWTRTTDSNPNWDVDKLLAELWALVRAFAQTAPQEHLCESFRATVDRLEPLIPHSA